MENVNSNHASVSNSESKKVKKGEILSKKTKKTEEVEGVISVTANFVEDGENIEMEVDGQN